MASPVNFFDEVIHGMQSFKVKFPNATKAINTAFGGVGDSIHNIFGRGKIDGEDFITAIKRAHTVDNTLGEGAKYSAAKIAGSVFAVGAVGRELSGGGLYKDKNGNTDIIGIPFI